MNRLVILLLVISNCLHSVGSLVGYFYHYAAGVGITKADGSARVFNR